MAPKNHSGISRGKGKGAKATAQAQTATKSPAEKLHPYGGEGKTWEPVDVQINASEPNALEKLREMAERGEIPSSVIGSRDDRARWFEEFDRLYAEPPGELGKYKSKEVTRRRLRLSFEHDRLNNRAPDASTGHDLSKASPSEISGAIKYAIYQRRAVLEDELMYRSTGWPTFEMNQKYGDVGKRVFSNAEKTRIDGEIRAYIEGQFKSPLTKAGERNMQTYWERVSDGWVRSYRGMN